MKTTIAMMTLAGMTLVSGCQSTTQMAGQTAASADACGASQYQNLVGGPSSAAMALTDIPGSSRHYGSQEAVATNNVARLNFVHSGTAIEAVVDPNSKVVSVFCG